MDVSDAAQGLGLDQELSIAVVLQDAAAPVEAVVTELMAAGKVGVALAPAAAVVELGAQTSGAVELGATLQPPQSVMGAMDVDMVDAEEPKAPEEPTHAVAAEQCAFLSMQPTSATAETEAGAPEEPTELTSNAPSPAVTATGTVEVAMDDCASRGLPEQEACALASPAETTADQDFAKASTVVEVVAGAAFTEASAGVDEITASADHATVQHASYTAQGGALPTGRASPQSPPPPEQQLRTDDCALETHAMPQAPDATPEAFPCVGAGPERSACGMDVDTCDPGAAPSNLAADIGADVQPSISAAVTSPCAADACVSVLPAMAHGFETQAMDSSEEVAGELSAAILAVPGAEGMTCSSAEPGSIAGVAAEAVFPVASPVAADVDSSSDGPNADAHTFAVTGTADGAAALAAAGAAAAQLQTVGSSYVDAQVPALADPASEAEQQSLPADPDAQLPQDSCGSDQPGPVAATSADPATAVNDGALVMPPDMDLDEADISNLLPADVGSAPAEQQLSVAFGDADTLQEGEVAAAACASEGNPLSILALNSVDEETAASVAADAAAEALSYPTGAVADSNSNAQSPQRPGASSQNDPMLVSPMPLRLSLQPPPPAAAVPGQGTAQAFASPEAAAASPRAFQLCSLDEQPSGPPLEGTGLDQASPQPTAGEDCPEDAAMEEAEFCLAADAAAAVEALTLTVQSSAAAQLCEPVGGPNDDVSQPGEPQSAAATAFPAEVGMPDSIETMDAMFGGDDLLAEARDGDGFGLLPPPVQDVSSPVSTGKSQDPINAGAARKPNTETLQSLDLFSLRASYGRVSDSLLAESLDTFEAGTKKSVMPFIPLAPLREAAEQEAECSSLMGAARRLSGIGAGPAGSASPPVPLTGSSPIADPAQLQSPAATANKPMAAGSIGRAGAVPGKAAGAAAKGVAPASARAVATPSSALKALAVGSTPSSIGQGKVGSAKRTASTTTAQPKGLSTPVQPAGRAQGGSGATSAVTTTRNAAPASTKAPPLSPFPGGTPSANTLRTGLGMRATALAGVTPSPLMHGRAGPSVAAGAGQVGAKAPGAGLFATPEILRAAAIPLADSPFPGSDFDLDTVDISAEAYKALAMLEHGEGDIVLAPHVAGKQQGTPVLVAPGRGVGAAAAASTPSTKAVLDMHIQMLTAKLAEAEARNQKLEDDNVMLRDQLSTLQFERSMTNEVDMEREARQFLEQELNVLRQRYDTLEADARAAHAEAKRREQAAAELQATLQAQEAALQAALQAKEAEFRVTLQAKEAAWAQSATEQEQRVQKMQAELQTARVFVQEADGRISKAEAQAAEATARCNEEIAKCEKLSSTLGLQTMEAHQIRLARDETEGKFQKAMEQLITASTTHKKQIVEYEQKIQQQAAVMAQVNEFRERYRQMKQMYMESNQRVQEAEAKALEKASTLQKVAAEKEELIRMCSELLTQLEESKAKR